MMKKISRYQIIVFFVMPFLLSWPAWFNGQPFLFADTTSYIKGGASALELAIKTSAAQTWLTPRPSIAPAHAGAAPAVDADQYSSTPDKGGVIAGRSAYYGFFLFVTDCLLGLKAVPLLQALIGVALIVSVARARFQASYRAIAAALLVLAVASPLPFFNSMLMPDVFAGLGITAAVALILVPQAVWPLRLFWALLLLAAVLFHTGNIMILLATIVTLFFLSLLVRRRAPPAAAVLTALAMVVLGIGGESLFSLVVKDITHAAPIRPPFMTARLLADGPGNDFVARHCAAGQFEVCKYPRDFTRATSDDFLWSQDPAIGVFTVAAQSSRRLLGQQDFGFAKAVFMQEPMAVISNSLRNIGQQLGFIGLQEFTYEDYVVRDLSQKIPAAEQAELERSRAATGRFDVHYNALVIRIASVISVLICIAYAVRSLLRKERENAVFVTIFLLSVLINAGVCGALSTPHDRYQARIMWLPELLAVAVLARRFNK